jgi:hypothetical protein
MDTTSTSGLEGLGAMMTPGPTLLLVLVLVLLVVPTRDGVNGKYLRTNPLDGDDLCLLLPSTSSIVAKFTTMSLEDLSMPHVSKSPIVSNSKGDSATFNREEEEDHASGSSSPLSTRGNCGSNGFTLQAFRRTSEEVVCWT